MRVLIAALLALTASANAAEENPAACASLRARLAQVERQQNQPQTGEGQDRLTAEHRRIEAEMDKLNCSRM